MSLGEEAMLDLMAYADGELDGEARERIEALVAKDPEAARMLEELRTLSACIQVSEKQRRVPKSVDHIVDSVMENLPRRPEPAVFEPKVVRMKRAVAAGAVSAALALAAGWFMFFRGPQHLPEHSPGASGDNVVAVAPSEKPPEENSSGAAPPEDPAEEETAENAGDEGGGVDLEQVESDNEVSIFYVPAVAAAHASSVVVWIGEVNSGVGE